MTHFLVVTHWHRKAEFPTSFDIRDRGAAPVSDRKKGAVYGLEADARESFEAFTFRLLEQLSAHYWRDVNDSIL